MVLLNVFKKLKQKVLWKWETEHMEGKSDNVRLSKWLPQQDILAHPNTRLFITHAGQSSCQETMCHMKPVVSGGQKMNSKKPFNYESILLFQVAVPVAGDQPMNAHYLEYSGLGETVPYQQLTEEKLLDTINKVLQDPSYTKNAQERRGEFNQTCYVQRVMGDGCQRKSGPRFCYLSCKYNHPPTLVLKAN